jgi:hypothetical protein
MREIERMQQAASPERQPCEPERSGRRCYQVYDAAVIDRPAAPTHHPTMSCGGRAAIYLVIIGCIAILGLTITDEARAVLGPLAASILPPVLLAVFLIWVISVGVRSGMKGMRRDATREMTASTDYTSLAPRRPKGYHGAKVLRQALRLPDLRP